MVMGKWGRGWHPAIRLGLLGAVIWITLWSPLYLVSRRLLGAKAGTRYTYVLRGGPRDGETRSITFCFPEGTLFEIR